MILFYLKVDNIMIDNAAAETTEAFRNAVTAHDMFFR